MLSFQIKNENRTIEISCDNAGISQLVEVLTRLRGSGNHVHLLTPSCGGSQLSEKTPYGENAIGEVIISHGGD
ncbi:hypothetical protein [Bradyrhizobium iriomotense]|uniref:hypothetical protein n=1 Tax=Bradyrhizobium iriomotense TaxID=441950 RepID=UPI0024E0B9A1|nr:hypothetical protein [Bradyrhizobium iriomotense]